MTLNEKGVRNRLFSNLKKGLSSNSNTDVENLYIHKTVFPFNITSFSIVYPKNTVRNK